MSENKSWLDRLGSRWNVTPQRAVIILIVFACTGCSVMFLKAPILNLLFDGAVKGLIPSILYFILILPVYNILLLIYGAIFGQFNFFWEFEKRFFKRMGRLIRLK